MRCERCSVMTYSNLGSGKWLMRNWRKRKWLKHHQNIQAIEDSAKAGCELCHLIHAAIQLQAAGTRESINKIANLKGGVRFCGGSYRKYQNGDHGLDYEYLYEDERSKFCEILFIEDDHGRSLRLLLLAADYGSQASSFTRIRHVASDPDNNSTMHMIRSLLKICDKTHKKCHISRAHQNGTLPTRVINVTGSPRLEITTEGQLGKYIALSYCWGKKTKNLLLSRSTLLEFQKGIEIDAMPQTVRDAIITARHLGINYMWVDALCIVQQEPDLCDFLNEAPRMAEYYGNAYLTLVAASATDCGDGFLNDRSLDPRCCSIPSGRARKNLNANTSDEAYLVLPRYPNVLDDVSTTEPIEKRSWTFQERELSPRALVFHAKLFALHCSSYVQSENGHYRDKRNENVVSPLPVYDSKASMDSLPMLLASIETDGHPLDSGYAQKKLRERWSYVVRNYSDTERTDPRDVFTALSGLAKRFQSLFRTKYMFGLWEKSLIEDLLWVPPHLGARGLFSEIYLYKPTLLEDIMPSWTWAKLNGPVQWDDTLLPPNGEEFTRIVSHKSIAGALDPVRDGHTTRDKFELYLEGPIQRVQLQEEHSLEPLKIFLDQPIEGLDISVDCSHRYESITSLNDDKTYTVELYAIRLNTGSGLLLLHVDENTYKRVGLYTYYNCHGGLEAEKFPIRTICLI